MALRRNELTPGYTFDDVALRYRDASGRFVPNAEVRAALDGYLQNKLAGAAEGLLSALRSGEMSVREVQLAGEREIVTAHLGAAALALGGWAQMNQTDFGRVGGLVKPVLEEWRDLMVAVGDGAPLDRRVVQGVREAINAARAGFHSVESDALKKRGYDQYMNDLNDGAKHCAGSKGRPSCPSVTARGWVKTGQLPATNKRGCWGNCQCRFKYRNSKTGEVRD